MQHIGPSPVNRRNSLGPYGFPPFLLQRCGWAQAKRQACAHGNIYHGTFFLVPGESVSGRLSC